MRALFDPVNGRRDDAPVTAERHAVMDLFHATQMARPKKKPIEMTGLKE
jgi:hypothetical protein